MNDNLFCKIFVLSTSARDEITRHVAEHVGGRLDSNSLVCDWGVVDVLKNDDADCDRLAEADGFLHFPYLIETEPDENFERERFVSLIGSLLESLWSSHCDAVAACDFEQELPQKGGYALIEQPTAGTMPMPTEQKI